MFRATRPAIVGRSNNRSNASAPALVSISASRICSRSGVSSGNDSASSATALPSSGGGRFESDGGTMISIVSGVWPLELACPDADRLELERDVDEDQLRGGCGREGELDRPGDRRRVAGAAALRRRATGGRRSRRGSRLGRVRTRGSELPPSVRCDTSARASWARSRPSVPAGPMIWSQRSVRSSSVYWRCWTRVSRPRALGRIQNWMNRSGSSGEPFFSECRSPRARTS